MKTRILKPMTGRFGVGVALVLIAVAAFTLAACGGGGDQGAADPAAKPGETIPVGQDTTEIAKAKQLNAAPPEGPRVTSAPQPPCGQTMNAAWAFIPKSFTEASNAARTTVTGTVVSVEAGADMVQPAPGEPGGELRIPTQKITFKVEKGHKGQSKAGETITLFKTGSDCLAIEHDPVYSKDEKYLLLLEAGPGQMMRPISPEGRYKVKTDGTLEAFVANEATAAVTGKKVKDIEQMLATGAVTG